MDCIHDFQIPFYMSPEVQVFSLYDPVRRGMAGCCPPVGQRPDSDPSPSGLG